MQLYDDHHVTAGTEQINQKSDSVGTFEVDVSSSPSIRHPGEFPRQFTFYRRLFLYIGPNYKYKTSAKRQPRNRKMSLKGQKCRGNQPGSRQYGHILDMRTYYGRINMDVLWTYFGYAGVQHVQKLSFNKIESSETILMNMGFYIKFHPNQQLNEKAKTTNNGSF